MKNTLLTSLLLVLFSILYSQQVICQESVRIKRMTNAIEFDGKPGVNEWEGLDQFPLTMNRPNFGNEPTELSEIMIGYDNEFLWVGARLFMKDPGKIFAASKRRDEMLFGFDSFGLLIDTYNDNENALAFFTTPTGLRTDYTISNDAGGSGGFAFGSMNYSWNTFWDVKTTRDEKGWYVEMRIPFSSLKFKPQNDVAEMGLIVSRTISASNETDTWPAIDPKYGMMATNKPSLANNIIIEGARPKNPIYVSPYIITGFSREHVLNDDETKYIPGENWTKNIGGDIKYNINSNLTLDVTVNTDFAQVEADNQQVNLTQYSLFFPEKRMFFQERSSLFSFNLGGFSDNLFYSRRIGISDYGEPIKIYGGGRLAGRIGKWDMGIINMQTEKQEEKPSENFGVFRMRRQVINENSYAGGIVTSRIGADGTQNYAYGLDAIVRAFGVDYVTLKWAQTYDTQIDTSTRNFVDPSVFLVNWERRTDEGFAYNLSYTRSGETFNPGIGFIRRPSVWGAESRLMYGWLPGEKSKLFNYNVFFSAERYERLEDNKLESMEMRTGIEFNTKSQYGFELMLNYNKEDVLYGYNITDSIAINTGLYEQLSFSGNIRMPESQMFSAFARFEGGEFYDGKKYSISIRPSVNISSSLQISGGYGIDAISFPERESNKKATIHNISGRILYMLNTKLSASALIQYVNTADDFIGNFRLRYNPREGNDFYLVYNDYRCLKNLGVIPEKPSFFNKTIMIKYTHTFIL